MPLSDHQMKPGQQPKPVTEDKWNQILDVFRQAPKDYAQVVKTCGVSRETAKKAWEYGWPDRDWPPIKLIMKDEGLLARAERAKKEQARALIDREAMLAEQAKKEAEARLQARQDAIMARAQEGKMVALSRGNTIALQAAAARLMKIAVESARELEEDIKAKRLQMTPKEKVKFVTSVAYLNESIVRAAKINIEMERQLLGEPTEVIGISAGDMSLDDAARTVIVAGRALKRAARRGMVDKSTMDALQAELFEANKDVIDVQYPEESINSQVNELLGDDFDGEEE